MNQELIEAKAASLENVTSDYKWGFIQGAHWANEQAKLESQEPVAWIVDYEGDKQLSWYHPKNSPSAPLFAHPPQRTEPAHVRLAASEEKTPKTKLDWVFLLEHRFGFGVLSQRDIDIAVEVERMVNFTTPPAQPAQRTWVGLTDEETAKACGWSAHGWWTHPMSLEIKIAKAIEAKLKEKNND